MRLSLSSDLCTPEVHCVIGESAAARHNELSVRLRSRAAKKPSMPESAGSPHRHIGRRRAQPAFRCDERSRAGNFARLRSDRARSPGFSVRTCRIMSSPSSGSSEQLEKTIRPPGLTMRTALSSRRAAGLRASRCRPAISSRARPDGGGPCRSRNTARRAARHRRARPAAISAYRLRRSRRQAEPVEIGREPRQRLREEFDGGHPRAGGGELRGLAAGRRAKIGDAQALTSPNSRAGSAAAASCTHHAPSA